MHPDPVLCRNTALNINIHDLLIGFIPAKSLLPISSTLPLEAAYLDLMSLSVNRVDIDKIFPRTLMIPIRSGFSIIPLLISSFVSVSEKQGHVLSRRIPAESPQHQPNAGYSVPVPDNSSDL